MKRSAALTPLPALPGGRPECRAAVSEVRRAHADLRARGEALDTEDLRAARELGERLANHVRFEERVLFPLLEAALDDDALAALGAALADAER